MKKMQEYIDRQASLLTGKENLENLFTFKDFPVYMGCVETPPEEDVVANMEWNICRDSGVIQLGKLLPLDVLYLAQHNDGVGKIWQEHYAAFADFLSKYKPRCVLEIGGAHDHVARNVWRRNPAVDWTTVEPNPQFITDPRVKVIRGWFDGAFKLDAPVDMVIHSHVFEHTYDPLLFIEHIGSFLKKGGKHVFTFPNMLPMLEKKFTNCLNFEHTAFLTEEIADYVLERTGFKILEKEYYGNPHSIFYATEKIDLPASPVSLPHKYEEYKKLFMEYVAYHSRMVEELNRLTAQSVDPIYLFGAHIFSQTLIQFGLKTDAVACILDNSPLKHKKRLYGTSLVVESPQILRGKGKVKVILKAGIYDEEIKKDILENINNEVEFF